MTLVKRISDGALFEPSYPDNMAGMLVTTADTRRFIAELERTSDFYFRHVVPSGKRWFEFWRKEFVRTGMVWEPVNEGEFDVVDL